MAHKSALAEALRKAADAGRWGVVAQLAEELKAHPTAAAGNVVALPRAEPAPPADLPGGLALHIALVAALAEPGPPRTPPAQPPRSLAAPGPRPPATRRSPLALAGFDPVRYGL